MQMKKILFISVLFVSLMACHETTIGYLVTKDASYDPDTMYIRKTPDPVLDAVRLENNAPWISFSLQGYRGTEPISFSVESVGSSEGEEAARLFKEELQIRGGGALMYPFRNNARPGFYTVSVRLTNEGYSQVIAKALTFVVLE